LLQLKRVSQWTIYGQIGDIATTIVGVMVLGMPELNPLWAKSVLGLVAVKILAIIGIVIVLERREWGHKRAVWVVPGIGIGTAVWNIAQIGMYIIGKIRI